MHFGRDRHALVEKEKTIHMKLAACDFRFAEPVVHDRKSNFLGSWGSALFYASLLQSYLKTAIARSTRHPRNSRREHSIRSKSVSLECGGEGRCTCHMLNKLIFHALYQVMFLFSPPCIRKNLHRCILDGVGMVSAPSTNHPNEQILTSGRLKI